MRWNLERRKIQEVYPNDKNTRKLSKRQAEELQNSLEKFGLCQPIVVTHNGRVIGGHQRLRILARMGYTHVEVYAPAEALSAEDEEELTIRLNKNVGDWNYDILANEWDFEKLLGWGFSESELDCRLSSLNGSLASDETEAIAANSITKKGDLYAFV